MAATPVMDVYEARWLHDQADEMTAELVDVLEDVMDYMAAAELDLGGVYAAIDGLVGVVRGVAEEVMAAAEEAEDEGESCW